jgi:hypothetical protein
MIEPENLVLTGPNNEQITFWNTLRTEATCPNNKEFKVVILGSLKTFTPVMKDDKVTPCYSIAFQPGKSSMWQLYRIDFIGTPVQYDYIHTILESIQYS